MEPFTTTDLERDHHLCCFTADLSTATAWASQLAMAETVTLVMPDTRNAGRSLGFLGEVTMTSSSRIFRSWRRTQVW